MDEDRENGCEAEIRDRASLAEFPAVAIVRVKADEKRYARKEKQNERKRRPGK